MPHKHLSVLVTWADSHKHKNMINRYRILFSFTFHLHSFSTVSRFLVSFFFVTTLVFSFVRYFRSCYRLFWDSLEGHWSPVISAPVSGSWKVRFPHYRFVARWEGIQIRIFRHRKLFICTRHFRTGLEASARYLNKRVWYFSYPYHTALRHFI